MQSNPFSPPGSVPADLDDDKARKPVGVWLVQVFALPMTYLVLQGLVNCFEVLVAPGGVIRVHLLVTIALDVVVLVTLAVTMAGSEFRWRYARWSGQLLVLLFCLFLGYFLLFVDRPNRPASGAMVDVVLASSSLIVGVLLCRGYAFSAKARAWFRASSIV